MSTKARKSCLTTESRSRRALWLQQLKKQRKSPKLCQTKEDWFSKLRSMLEVVEKATSTQVWKEESRFSKLPKKSVTSQDKCSATILLHTKLARTDSLLRVFWCMRELTLTNRFILPFCMIEIHRDLLLSAVPKEVWILRKSLKKTQKLSKSSPSTSFKESRRKIVKMSLISLDLRTDWEQKELNK